MKNTSNLKTLLCLSLTALAGVSTLSAWGQSPTPTGSKTLAKVLEPSKFFGQARAGYAAAQKIPDICSKLFCYCGCDETDCHGSLLDCFTSEHGEDCHICQEEAVIALKLQKKGKSLMEIQETIDKRFSGEYPFEEESDTYKAYKASRLWGKNQPPRQIQRKGGSAPKKGTKTGASCCGGKTSKTSKSESK